jgi:DNA-binding winged helix-turn-helix (wHTH) protein/TolB-like protein/predicted Zn-dependent protease
MSLQKKRLYDFGCYRLDARRRVLLSDDEVVPLPPKAIDLLVVLVESGGQVLSKDELINLVWQDSFVEEANLSHHVFILRKALGEDKNGSKFIETIPRRGYRFVSEVTELGIDGDDLIIAEHSRSKIIVDQSETHEDRPGEMKIEQSKVVGVSEGGRANALGINKRLVLITVICAIALGIGIYLLITAKPTSQRALAGVKSIAILPFKLINSGAGNEYLGVGMADALITRFGSLRQLIVRPTNAVARYNTVGQDPVAAGRDLNVDAVLDGTIQTSGDRMRVTLQLVRVDDGTHLWTDKFEEKSTDLFDVQDLVSEKASRALALELSGTEGKQFAKRYTENQEAYQLYLKGIYFWNKFEADELKKATSYFQQASEKDPNYALAYAGLAHSYNVLGLNFLPSGEAFPQARLAAAKALALDDTLAEAHAALGAIHLFYNFAWQEAERELQRAIELNPNYSTAHELYAYYLIATGRVEEGIAQGRRAQTLDPLSLVISDDIASGLYYARRYDEAIEQARKTIELDQKFSGGHFWLGLLYAQKGRAEEAIAELNQAISYSRQGQNIAMLGQVFGMLGRRSEAQKIIADLTKQAGQQYVSPTDVARIYAALGDSDQSITWLSKAYEQRAGWIIYLKVDPIFDSIRSDPRFTDLLGRMKFPRQ